MIRSAAIAALAVLSAGPLGAGCGGRRARPAEQRVQDSDARERAAIARAAWLPAPARPTPALPVDEVVAEVDGVPIYASEAAAQARARRITARAAVDELIARELLAAEARRRGYQEDRAVIEARHAPLARALLARDFAPTFDGPEDIPAAEIASAYQANLSKFVAPESREVLYVRASDAKPTPPAAAARAEAIARAFRARFPAGAAARVDCDAVKAAAVEAQREEPSLAFEVYDAWASATDPVFAKVMFALPEPGALSEPFKTPWGWDVLCLKKITPPKNVSLAEAEPELRTRFFETARAAAFQRFLTGALRTTEAAVVPGDVSVRRAFPEGSVAAPTP